MAVRRCNTCTRRIIDATGRDGQALELAEYRGPQLWGTRAEKIRTPTGVKHINKAYKAVAYVTHQCEAPGTLGDPALPGINFPSLGDPVDPCTCGVGVGQGFHEGDCALVER